MVEQIRVGNKTYRIDRSKMSSSKIRSIERQIQQARKTGQAEQLRREQKINALRREARRAKAAREEARELRRELTLARRGIASVSLQSKGGQARGAAGLVSSTFQQAVASSRGTAAERAYDRRLRKQEAKERARVRKLEREIEREELRGTKAEYPKFIRPTAAVSPEEAARASARAARGDFVGTPGGAEPFRQLPPDGGGRIRQLLARTQLEYGGGMAGTLRPEAAQQLGFKRLFGRQARSQRELGLIPQAPPKAYRAPGPTSRYEVLDVRTGETKTFRKKQAAESFAARQAESERTRQLRATMPKAAAGVVSPTILTQPSTQPIGYETSTTTGLTITSTPETRIRKQPFGLDLPFVGRVEEPLFSPILARGAGLAEQKIKRAKVEGTKQKTLAQQLKDLTGQAAVIRREPERQPIRETKTVKFIRSLTGLTREQARPLERVSQLDIPKYDIDVTPGGEAIVTGATTIAAAVSGKLPAFVAGATTGRKVAQATESPLLGVGTAFFTAYGTDKTISKFTKSTTPKTTKLPKVTKPGKFKVPKAPKLKIPKLKDIFGTAKKRKITGYEKTAAGKQLAKDIFEAPPKVSVKVPKGQQGLSFKEAGLITDKLIKKRGTSISGRSWVDKIYGRTSSRTLKGTGLGRRGQLQLQTITKAPTKVALGTTSILKTTARGLTGSKSSPFIPAGLAAVQTGMFMPTQTRRQKTKPVRKPALVREIKRQPVTQVFEQPVIQKSTSPGMAVAQLPEQKLRPQLGFPILPAFSIPTYRQPTIQQPTTQYSYPKPKKTRAAPRGLDVRGGGYGDLAFRSATGAFYPTGFAGPKQILSIAFAGGLKNAMQLPKKKKRKTKKKRR